MNICREGRKMGEIGSFQKKKTFYKNQKNTIKNQDQLIKLELIRQIIEMQGTFSLVINFKLNKLNFYFYKPPFLMQRNLENIYIFINEKIVCVDYKIMMLTN